MAETNYQRNIKDKIIAVRSVVPGKSNNEIILVLQQFDDNVDKAIQAFLDGSAVQVLKEWNMTGKKKVNKRKKSKSKHQQCIKDESDKADKASEGPQGIYGYHLEDCDKDNCSSEFTNDKTEVICYKDKTFTLEEPSLTHQEITEKKVEQQNELSVDLQSQPCNGIQMHQDRKSSVQQKLNSSKSRSRPITTKSHAPTADTEQKLEDSIKKRGPNIEKSVKDLQRCAVSLTRYHIIIKEDIDISVKKIKATFAELHSCIIEREVMLLSEVDKVKEEAMKILTARQKKAEGLKRMTDLASQMAENKLSELRAEIKHFVSERKYDEELGRSARFSCDIEQLKRQILLCGELSHPKNYYSLRPSNSSALSAKCPHVENAKQSTPVQKSPRNSKISERKATNTKALNDVPHNLTESSRQRISPSKQNGPLGQRRRFNTRSPNIWLNGTAESPGINNAVDHDANKNFGQRRQPPNNFKMRNKGMVNNHDQSSSVRTTTTLVRNSPKVEAADSPSANATSVSHCYLHPEKIEVSADPAVLSVPTVTSVA